MFIKQLLATPEAAQVSLAAAYELGVGRFVPTTAAFVGLLGTIAGGGALFRGARRLGNNGRNGAIVALVAGLVSVIVGGVHGANAAGGPGTGNGVVGAVFAGVLGLIAIVLGGLALARSRRTTAPTP
jgi:hypothetical protein